MTEVRETLKEFKLRKKFPKNRKTEYAIRGSWGSYDFYKYYRKTKPEDPKYILTEGQFYDLFRMVNERLVDNLINTGELEFPYRMGSLIVKKQEVGSYIDHEGKRKTNRSVDWNKTLELWYDDEEEYKKKTLLYIECPRIVIKYDKRNAIYKNKYYYEFHPNREIKKRVNTNSVVSYIMNRELSEQIKGLYDG